ncbi:MAG: transcription termination/antitermination NusG family protein [Pseudomonadota bacterium]
MTGREYFGGSDAAPSACSKANARHWYLAQVKPGGFDRARLNLARQDFQTFMPVRNVTKRRGRRLANCTEPLFRGYLFVRMLPEQRRWRTVDSTFGVSRLVRLGGDTPTPVPQMLMAGLLARTLDDGTLAPQADFAAGERVRITAGPFATQIAEIETLEDAGRINVLIEMMGRVVRTSVKYRALERAQTEHPVRTEI